MKIKSLPLKSIKVGDRFREDMGDIKELAENLSDKGLIQPITVDENYNLIAGRRRLAAAELLEWPKIDCVIRKVANELDFREVELFENLHRKDMTWQEQAHLTKRIHELLVEQHGKDWSLTSTGKKIDRPKAHMSRMLQLAEAMEFIPELAEQPNVLQAQKKLNRIVDELRTQKALRETEGKSFVKYAADHFKIGNALECMPKLNPGVVHFAEVDPPYAIALTDIKPKSSTGASSYTEISVEEYPAFLEAAAKGVYDALYAHAYCIWWFGPTHHHLVKTVLEGVGFKVDDIPAIWYKVRSGIISYNPETYLARAYEPFFVCRKGNPALRNKGRSNIFEFPAVPAQNRIHTTEKPVELLRELLKTFAWPNAIVLVPFLGSGNTLLACYDEKMLGHGWDLSKKHKRGFLHRVSQREEE